jgi:hypothetical protein
MGEFMRLVSRTLLTVFCFGLAVLWSAISARAQTFVPTISLKSGESTDLLNVYWVVNCRSMLKTTPQVEIIDGPPQVSVAVKDAMVTPRGQNCAKPVQGGTVVLTAKEIDDPSNSRLTLRIKYNGKDGNRQSSLIYDVALFP